MPVLILFVVSKTLTPHAAAAAFTVNAVPPTAVVVLINCSEFMLVTFRLVSNTSAFEADAVPGVTPVK